MEKFRAVLKVLERYHFWILCGLIVVLSFVSWYLAAGDEDERYAKGKVEINQQFDVANKISADTEHPSEKYIQEIRARDSGTLAKQVANAATHLYSEQRESNPLPKVFTLDKDQKEFKAAFEKTCARPIEDIVKLPAKEQLDNLYRTRYSNHIQDHLPKLFELIERRQMSTPTSTDQTPQMVGVVDWDDADQKVLAFKARFSGPTPNTLDVAMAQEDLWVYETLLKVVRNTNDFGTDPKHETNYQKAPNHKVARIKKIWSMDIGRDALDIWSKSERPLFTLPGDAGSAASSAASAGDLPPALVPLVSRYLDKDGKPLMDPRTQPFPEFRMMPIDLKVDIEQKDIPRLLAECANSAMRIDIRAVRILAQDPGPVTDMGSTDTQVDPAAGGANDPNAPKPTPVATPTPTQTQTPSPFGKRRSRGGSPGVISPRGDYMKSVATVPIEESADPIYPPVPVEVQGIIYIYNPPPDQIAGTTAGAGSGLTAASGGTAASAGTAVSAGATTSAGTATTPATGSVAPAPSAPANPAPGPAGTGVPTSPPAAASATGGRP